MYNVYKYTTKKAKIKITSCIGNLEILDNLIYYTIKTGFTLILPFMLFIYFNFFSNI